MNRHLFIENLGSFLHCILALPFGVMMLSAALRLFA